MKAVVLEEVGKIVVKDVPKPEPGPKEILIKVNVCGICGTDLKLYKGQYTAKVPVILGHEFSGDVVEVGNDVKNVKVGDKVVPDPNESCGACNWCRSARPCFCNDLAAYGVLRDGGFAEYAVVGEKGAYKMPDGLSYSDASFAEPVSCVVHAIDRADIKSGEVVLIIGGGPTGQLLLQLAKAAGAGELIMVTRSQWKLDLAKKLGATKTINAKEEDVIKKTMDITEGLGADVVIEAVGTPETVEEALKLARKSGRVLIFGFCPEGKEAKFVPFDVLSKELTIMGSWVNPYTFPRALDILASGKLNLSPLISKELNLDNVMEGFNLMSEKPTGFMKALVKP